MVVRLENVTLVDAAGFRPRQTLIAAEGRWIYVGPSHTAPPLSGTVLPLPPHAVLLPPFADTHMHLVGWGLEQLLPSLEGETLAEVFERIREGVVRFPDWPAYVFWGVDDSRLREGRLPTREELDRILPDRPLVVRRVCGHVAVLNTPALKRLPKRDAFVDVATGRVVEHWALRIRDLFPPTVQQMDEAFLRAQEEALRQGVLMVHEFGDARVLQTLLRAWRDRALVLHVRFYLYDEDRHLLHQLPLPQGFGPSRLRLMGIKLFLDGSVGGRTAAFEEPYQDAPSTRGTLLYSDRRLLHRLRWARERGLQVAMHAIGDRAIHQAVRVLRKHLEGRGNTGGYRMEHVEFPSPEALQALAEMGIRLSVQPNFKGRWGQPGGMYERRLGTSRAQRNNPLSELARMQIPHAYGTDGMPFDLGYALEVARREVPFREALYRVTEGAWELTDEREGWGFRVGARADAQVVQIREGEHLPRPPVGWILRGNYHPLQEGVPQPAFPPRFPPTPDGP